MSELITATRRKNFHWHLLTTASVVALLASAPMQAKAEDADRPILWLELGGQFQSLNNPSENWVPPNMPPVIDHSVTGILGEWARIGYDADGRITLQPTGSDWSFSASVQYGRAKRGPKFAHDQTYKTHEKYGGNQPVPTTYAFTDLHSVKETSHAVLDFQAGRNVGLGLFGSQTSSTFNFGVRFAQFHQKADVKMSAATGVPSKYAKGPTFSGYMHSVRSFHGVGPSIAWNGSVPVVGSLDDGLAFDWGANFALLFGRQKADARTHTEKNVVTGYQYSPYPYFARTMATHSTARSLRSKGVTVPNLGAFAGVSYRVGGRGKVALGYRADFFFGAMDGGIGSRRAEDIGFHGPFATISLGLGG